MPQPPESFDRWVSPHLGVLAALAVREVGHDAAQDVLQEALLRAWQRRETYDSSRSLRAWLAAVLLDQARRYRVRRLRPGPPVAELAADSLPIEARLDIERAVQSLPRRQRQVITLHYLVDLSVADIAAILRTSESAVKSNLRDGRKALHTLMETT